jgi:hypothetical protein
VSPAASCRRYEPSARGCGPADLSGGRPVPWHPCRPSATQSRAVHGGIDRRPTAHVPPCSPHLARAWPKVRTTCLQSTPGLSATVADLATSSSVHRSQPGSVGFRCGQRWWSASRRRQRQANWSGLTATYSSSCGPRMLDRVDDLRPLGLVLFLVQEASVPKFLERGHRSSQTLMRQITCCR